MEITKKKVLGALLILAGLLVFVPGLNAAMLAFIAQFVPIFFGSSAMLVTHYSTVNGVDVAVDAQNVQLNNIASGSTVSLNGVIHNNANNPATNKWVQYHFVNNELDLQGVEFTVMHNGVATTGTCAANGQLYTYSASQENFAANSDTNINSTFTINPQYFSSGTRLDVEVVDAHAC